LLIEAAMLAKGVFAETPAAQTDTLIYWRFAGGNAGPQVRNLDLPTPKAAAQALTGLAALLAHYALPQSAFLSKPRVEFITEIDDYDHLARRKEWAEAEAPE
jgi:ATP-dependent helicase/nuclease subunit B